ncbi:hypothetical protein Q7P37_006706 [Cladosporium fusiforme]
MSSNPGAESQRNRYPSQLMPLVDRSRSRPAESQGLPAHSMPLTTGTMEAPRPWPQTHGLPFDESQMLPGTYSYDSAWNPGDTTSLYQYSSPPGPWRAQNTHQTSAPYVSPYPEVWQNPSDRTSAPVPPGNPVWQQPSPVFADYQQLSPSRSDGSSSTHVSSIPSPYAAHGPFIKTEDHYSTATYGARGVFDPALHNAGRFASSEHYPADSPWSRKPFPTPMLPLGQQQAEDAKSTYDSDRSYDIDSLPVGADPRPLSTEARTRRGFTTPETANCQCDKCGKHFNRSNNLLNHMQSHDPERNQPHTCGFADCGRGFVRKTDLARHEQSVHLKARNHQCAWCGNAFARKDTLTRHVEEGCSKRPEVRKSSSKSRRPSARRARSSSYMVNSPSPARSPLRYPMRPN